MPTFTLTDFLARSSDKDFAETTLAKVLAGLPALSPSGPWLAGGALRRTVSGQEPESDFDFFFHNADQLAAFAADLEGRGLTKIRETEHHIHYRGNVGESKLPQDIQCIRFAFYESAAAVIDSFDFTICQLAYDGEILTVGEFALWDIGRKRLAVHKVSFPVSTMRRCLKYATQGYTACNGALTTILRQTIERPELQTELSVHYVD